MSWLSALGKLLLHAGEQGAEREGAEGVLRQAARGAEHAGADMAVRDSAPLAVQRGSGWWDAPAQPALPPPPRRLALPPPPRRLALPAPPPGGTRVPNVGPKPRGGQWMPDKIISKGQRYPASPEELARQSLPGGVIFSSDPHDVALRDWWHRALPRYIKNDFGTANDPLLSLAARGLHPSSGMTPTAWSHLVDDTLYEDSVGGLMFPHNELGGMPGAGDDLRGEFLAAAPWIAKMPVTDSVYSVDPGTVSLGFGHVADEMRNALSAPEFSGGPLSDLAVRPESLQRMSFPQAAEHVGRINQRRAEIMAQQQAELAANPAVHLVKEYPDSPQGMRWVELKMPDMPEGYSIHPDTNEILAGPNQSPNGPAGGWGDPRRPHLDDALRYEGDQMGHCVGGYCDDVASGRSRIFSLRDAKGAPHVTIETAPGAQYRDLEHAADEDPRFGDAWNQLHYGADPARAARPARRADGSIPTFEEYLSENHPDLLAEFNSPSPQNIVQIKGKQNRAPIEDYLPYVQDFVKTQGPWGHIGDFRNTDMVALPDGRYLPRSQMRQAFDAAGVDYSNPGTAKFLLNGAGPDDAAWDDHMHLFEGYAYGGRVEPHRDFARNPMAVF